MRSLLPVQKGRAMRWVEIITLRSPGNINRQFVDELLKGIGDSAWTKQLIGIIKVQVKGSKNFKYQKEGIMRSKTFIITLAAVLLVSICMAPRSNAFVGIAALTTIIAATFTSTAILNEAEKNHTPANEKKHAKAAAESRSPVKAEPVNMETAKPVGK